MGLFSFLFGSGPKRFSVANNALLAEHILPHLTSDMILQLKEQIFYIFRAGGFPNITDEFVVEKFDSSERVVQLNCIAIALNDLGVQPNLENEFWLEVRNPFRADETSYSEFKSVRRRLNLMHKIDIEIKQERLVFNEL